MAHGIAPSCGYCRSQTLFAEIYTDRAFPEEFECRSVSCGWPQAPQSWCTDRISNLFIRFKKNPVYSVTFFSFCSTFYRFSHFFCCSVGLAVDGPVFFQVVNTSTASQGEQFVIRQSTHPAASRSLSLNKNNPTSQPLLLPSPPHGAGVSLAGGIGGEPKMEYWSNLTLRRISEQDAGQYRCVARNKGGQVEANVSLQTPPAPVIILIEEETGMPQSTVVAIGSAIAILLLVGLLFLTVCLCRRVRRKKQLQQRLREQRNAQAAKQNGNGKMLNGNGVLQTSTDCSVVQNEQEKSLLGMDIEMDQHHNTSGQQSHHSDGYQVQWKTFFMFSFSFAFASLLP